MGDEEEGEFRAKDYAGYGDDKEELLGLGCKGMESHAGPLNEASKGNSHCLRSVLPGESREGAGSCRTKAKSKEVGQRPGCVEHDVESTRLEQNEPISGPSAKSTFDAVAIIYEASSVPQAKDGADWRHLVRSWIGQFTCPILKHLTNNLRIPLFQKPCKWP